MKILSTILCISLAFNVALFADEISEVKSFINRMTPKNKERVISLSRSDVYYGRGYGYLTDKESMLVKKEKKYYDKKSPEVSLYLPDYKKAVLEFEKSVTQYKNPLSAHLGLRCLSFLFDNNSLENIKRKKLFIETLYSEAKTCEGYIEYATMYAHGIGIKADLSKALEILREGRQNCWGRATDWERSIIKVKETQIAFRLKKLKK